MINFLSIPPDAKLDDYPLSALRNCLFSFLSAAPPYLLEAPSAPELKDVYAEVTMDPFF
jgi:hypothetical protein